MRTVLAVVVRDGQVLSYATNEHSPCPREGMPTGQGYELCEGCSYQNHAERKAVQGEVAGADVHLFGHTYACEPCKKAMRDAGIRMFFIGDEGEQLS